MSTATVEREDAPATPTVIRRQKHTGNLVPVTVRIDPELRDRIKRYSDERLTSESSVLAKIIEAGATTVLDTALAGSAS